MEVGVCVKSGVLGLAVLSYNGSGLLYAGFADYAELRVLAVGNKILYLIMKSFNVISNNIINSDGPMLFRSENC